MDPMSRQVTPATIETSRPWRKLTLLGTLVFLLLCGVVALPKVARAHDPLFLEEQHAEPENGPLLPDARISFALYGTLLSAQDQRGFQFQIPQGEHLKISLLVPDLAPENTFPEGSFPSLALRRPDQSVLVLKANLREEFAEPFSGTNYLRLLDFSEIGSAGTYQIRITGIRPTRFTVSIGYIEAFGTPVGNMTNRSSNSSALTEWYTTPPPPNRSDTGSPTTTQEQSAAETVPAPTSRPEAEVVLPKETDGRKRSPLLVAGGLVALAAIALIPLVRLQKRGGL
ncbi:MAG: hypothetical protein CL467_01565 [Acidimicrobiaceae bacterium]|nr:hypothetical protein [Acidimicrobiaceae bacterium]